MLEELSHSGRCDRRAGSNHRGTAVAVGAGRTSCGVAWVNLSLQLLFNILNLVGNHLVFIVQDLTLERMEKLPWVFGTSEFPFWTLDLSLMDL